MQPRGGGNRSITSSTCLASRDRAAPSTTPGTPRRREGPVFAAAVAPAERLGFGRCSARLPLGPFRRPRASAGQLCGGHRRAGNRLLKMGGTRNDGSAPRDVAGRVVGPRAEAGIRRGRGGGASTLELCSRRIVWPTAFARASRRR